MPVKNDYRSWTKNFAAAARKAAGSTRLMTPKKAEAMPKPYADNAKNYFEATGKARVNVDTLIGSAASYAKGAMTKAAGADGELSDKEIRKLPADLRDDVRLMHGAAPGEGASSVPAAKSLKNAIDAARIDTLVDYGKSIVQDTYSGKLSALEVVGKIADFELEDMDGDYGDYGKFSTGEKAVKGFAAAMRYVATQELDAGEDYSEKHHDIYKAIAKAVEAALLPASKLADVRYVSHSLAEDGDTSRDILLYKEAANGAWKSIEFSDYPF